jgi:Papain-like cysteine protease AvrRpt2
MAIPSLLNRTRVPLRLHGRAELTGTAVERVASDAVGEIVLPFARRLHLWRYVWWLLPLWDRLNFQMQHQQQTNWCWAAVSTSVALYYDPTSAWTQCTVANGELGRSDCCGAGGSTSCNVYGTLNTALTRVGHLDHMDVAVASFQAVDDEIDAGRPLGIRVAWSGGGAHFLVVIGYFEGDTNYVAVDDPIYGKSDLTYATLETAYQGSGAWTHSYYTRA